MEIKLTDRPNMSSVFFFCRESIASQTSLWVKGSALRLKQISSGELGIRSGGLSVGIMSSAIFWAIEVKKSLNSFAISKGSEILQLFIKSCEKVLFAFFGFLLMTSLIICQVFDKLDWNFLNNLSYDSFLAALTILL